MYKFCTCKSCNLYKLFAQVATCTKSQHVHNIRINTFVTHFLIEEPDWRGEKDTIQQIKWECSAQEQRS